MKTEYDFAKTKIMKVLFNYKNAKLSAFIKDSLPFTSQTHNYI